MINLPSYEAVAKICGKVAMDEGPSIFSMIMRLEFFNENLTTTAKCYDWAAAIMKDEIDKQLIPRGWTHILTTVTRSYNNKTRKR